MNKLEFNVASRSDKAGRSSNQDNFFLSPNLSSRYQFDRDDINQDRNIPLGPYGALFVVADGMGGMNAGEKASELVVNAIKQAFSSIPEKILGRDTEMEQFVADAICQADASVKQYAKAHPDTEGMGSTIVLMWLYGDKAICGWVGDSRIYRYNPNNKLVRLSHDHSYVQGLVDTGRITPEMAFDHPDSNIITRSLGDNGDVPHPETRIYNVYERDVFMLCSDGLCGLVPDAVTQEIISRNVTSSFDILQHLWAEGAKNGWSDNATIEVVVIAKGGGRSRGVAEGYPDVNPGETMSQQPMASVMPNPSAGIPGRDTRPLPTRNKSRSNLLWIIIAAVAVTAAIVLSIYAFNSDEDNNKSAEEVFDTEISLPVEGVQGDDHNLVDNINRNYQEAHNIFLHASSASPEDLQRMTVCANSVLQGIEQLRSSSVLDASASEKLNQMAANCRRILAARNGNSPSPAIRPHTTSPQRPQSATPAAGNGYSSQPADEASKTRSKPKPNPNPNQTTPGSDPEQNSGTNSNPTRPMVPSPLPAGPNPPANPN